ncbi:MAG: DUF4340 domain-containing protein [Pseudomonadota bacterium]
MSTRTLLNLALAALALGLGALIWYRPGLEQHAGVQTVTGIDPQTVSAIDLSRSGAEPLLFRKQAGHWLIQGATAIPADDFQVHTVLALLQATVVRSYPARTLALAGLGLDPPQASVRFDATQLDLGTTEAIDGLRYVRLGAQVYLVGDSYQHLPNAGLASFASRRLLPEAAKVTALQLPGLSLSLSDGVHWRLTPELPGVSADAIETLVQDWQHASALYVRRYEPGEFPETVRVTLQGVTDPVVFHIAAREPDLVLARPDWGIQYHLAGDVGTGLLALPQAPEEPLQE